MQLGPQLSCLSGVVLCKCRKKINRQELLWNPAKAEMYNSQQYKFTFTLQAYMCSTCVFHRGFLKKINMTKSYSFSQMLNHSKFIFLPLRTYHQSAAKLNSLETFLYLSITILDFPLPGSTSSLSSITTKIFVHIFVYPFIHLINSYLRNTYQVCTRVIDETLFLHF